MLLVLFWLGEDVGEGWNDLFLGGRIHLHHIHQPDALGTHESLLIVQSKCLLIPVEHLPLGACEVAFHAANEILVPFRVVDLALADVEVVHQTQ